MKQGWSSNGRRGWGGGEKGRGSASTHLSSPLFSRRCTYVYRPVTHYTVVDGRKTRADMFLTANHVGHGSTSYKTIPPRPTGDLWRRVVDRGHGGAMTRRPRRLCDNDDDDEPYRPTMLVRLSQATGQYSQAHGYCREDYYVDLVTS